MGEAFITRRNPFGHLSIESIEEHEESTDLLVGFNFKNKSYFFRLCYKQSGSTTRYFYNFLVERGGTLIVLSSYQTGGTAYDFIKSITVDIENGSIILDRKYATFLYVYPECVCVAMS